MKVGRKLKEVKELKKLKLKDLSRETGLSISFISDILNERSSPSLDTLEKLTGSLGVSPSYVMESASDSYLTGREAQLHELIRDYSLWPEEEQEDLLEYLQTTRHLRYLKSKKHP